MVRTQHTIFCTDLRFQSTGNKSNQVQQMALAQLNDQLLSQLHTIEVQIKELEVGVQTFKGPHFDKHYRAMQGLSVKLLTELDCLELSSNGREHLRQKRRLAIHKIENLAIVLESKGHKDGRFCEQCEIREMDL